MPFRELGDYVMEKSAQYTLAAVVLSTVALLAIRWMRASNIPTVNKFPDDYFLKKARAQFMSDARGLLREGSKKFDGPFRVVTAMGERIILPRSNIEWLKNNAELLDHQEMVKQEFFANYPGIEGNGAVNDPQGILIKVAKTKLNQTTQCKIVHDQIEAALKEHWTENKDWHTITWPASAVSFIGRMSAAVFVGPTLAADPEWQELTITHTQHVFAAIRALRSWPAVARPFVHRFLPEFIACRAQVRLARSKLGPLFVWRGVHRGKARAKAAEAAEAGGKGDGGAGGGKKAAGKLIAEDCIEYVHEEAGGRRFDAAAVQLGFAIAALHTTTQLLQQALLDVFAHPEVVGPLREEVEAAIAQHGWTTAGVFAMRLLDSCVKETQRLKPGSLVNLERTALKDVRLPSGEILRKGTTVCVDSAMMWDANVYPEPEKWDGWRFLRLREEGVQSAQLVSTSPEHIAFGLGKPICPGRFFAVNEVKIAMARILLDYDVRVLGSPKIMEMGFEQISDPEAKIEVRRR